MNSALVTSPAELLARLPITTFMKSGTLRLANDRLTFTTDNGEVEFDAPLSEFHSVSLAATGIHLWHINRCLKFAFRGENRHFAATWIATLKPIIGTPPVGLRVAAPWPKWAWTLALIGITLLLVAAIAALTTLNS